MTPCMPTHTNTPEFAAERLATARALATDAACAVVIQAWRKRGIEAIVLKGPSTAEWLYRGECRPYQDADLLVSPDRRLEAGAALHELGFTPASQPDSEHAHPWVRRMDGCVIDLHTTVWGMNRRGVEVWRELECWVEPRFIGRVEVHVLGVPARALHLALHAAQHREVPKPRADLRRALDHTSLSDWRQAEQLAERVWALPLMALGLQLEPTGRTLLRELPLARAGLLAEVDNAPLAVGLTRLAAARGVRGKANVLAKGIAPGGRFGTRVRWLLTGLPGTVRSIRRAKATRWELIDRG